MRTSTPSNLTITYPDVLAYAFNAMPVVVQLAEGSDERAVVVKVTANELSGEPYIDAKQTYKGKAVFDIRELVRIQYEELLRRDDLSASMNIFSAGNNTLIVRNYDTYGGYTESEEDFAVSRFVRQFTLSIYLDDVNTAIMKQTNISVIYGRGGFTAELNPTKLSKIWCGTNEVAQFILGPNSVLTIPGRMGYTKTEITLPRFAGEQYIGIVLHANFLGYGDKTKPEYIEVTNAPKFQTSGKLYEATSRIEYHGEAHVSGDNPKAIVSFLSPQGDVTTSILRPITQVVTSEVANTITTAEVPENVDFGTDRNGVAMRRKDVAYNIGYRLKYATANLPIAEIKRLREVIGSAFVALYDVNLTSATLRVYPVPASVELTSKAITGFNVEFELPTLNSVGQ